MDLKKLHKISVIFGVPSSIHINETLLIWFKALY
jgi:hypothetical protein